ncbi:hypothetical protein SAMN05444682_101760 [Parapedobacter indicus]|uniref:Uncharacterized protein n=1 Tax=Parapedobacter indicus TaxID=1477437 RepID=A0A1I3E4A0_9SPHI|nr:hypothetical protein CLV26_101774 [Parapedobacter indicus]SFH93817.1 hypothetical protein SAMN05444682_101760 [Parapedobacter indicus]
MNTFNVDEAIKAQKNYQQENKCPAFAPSNGICWKCKQQIYSEKDHGRYKTGISVEKASTQLVTGCPHCNRSYCD